MCVSFPHKSRKNLLFILKAFWEMDASTHFHVYVGARFTTPAVTMAPSKTKESS
jgi:hypothetical protein